MKWNDPKVSWALVLIGLLCLQAAGKLSWLTVLIPAATVLGYGLVRLGRNSNGLRHSLK